jgi:PAS domain S-box-containing protein/putative nucleotidyltransferase with HDIG domain
LLTPQGVFVAANPALCELLGRTAIEVVGRPLDVVADPASAASIREHLRHTLGSLSPLEATEATLLRRDGTPLFTLISTSALHGAADDPMMVAYVQDITAQRHAQRAHVEAEAALRVAHDGFVDALARATAMRDPHTGRHQEAVSATATATAIELGLKPDEVDAIRLAAMVHDIGKLALPMELLTRPGPLTACEHEIIKTHSVVGHNILAGVLFPWPLQRIVLEHHERLDGSGYPQGLAGDEIMLESRVVAVSDVLEAGSSHRPYRPALGLDHAYGLLRSGVGTLFDADIVEACIRAKKRQPRSIWSQAPASGSINGIDD